MRHSNSKGESTSDCLVAREGGGTRVCRGPPLLVTGMLQLYCELKQDEAFKQQR